MMKIIDLNCDLGESFGAYTLGMDSEAMPYITSANIACGFHASDPLTMERTVREAAKEGVSLGVHPGYPDLLGFGRRNMSVSPAEAGAYVLYQLGALSAFARACGKKLTHVKPHGAMYNMAAKDPALALAICEAVASFDRDLIVLSLSGSCMEAAAEKAGIRSASEVFADRAYMPDGSLMPRSREGAVIHDTAEAVSRTVRLIKEGVVRAADGTDIFLKADSVCVHGDSPGAISFLKGLREAFAREGIAAAPLPEVLGRAR